MKKLVISKKISWSIRSGLILSILILSYIIYQNVSKQTELDNVYDAASEQTKITCSEKTEYQKQFGLFKNKKRDNYYTCITESNDVAFKKEAARYILNTMTKNGENAALTELKQIMEK